jgi:2-oxoglutarate dehydrogenase E1 component
MSPKSLLRHPEVISSLSDFTKGHFEEVIDDNFATKSKVRRVIICSGKVFYDLRKEQEKRAIKDVALVRLEQFYPFPERQLAQVLKKYPKAETVWLQEEPQNMGGRDFILRTYKGKIDQVIARKASASPATGFMKVHSEEQQVIINSAFEK